MNSIQAVRFFYRPGLGTTCPYTWSVINISYFKVITKRRGEIKSYSWGIQMVILLPSFDPIFSFDLLQPVIEFVNLISLSQNIMMIILIT